MIGSTGCEICKSCGVRRAVWTGCKREGGAYLSEKRKFCGDKITVCRIRNG